MNRNVNTARRLRAAAVFCFGAMLAALPAFTQAGVDASRRNAIVKAIERVAPAVVTINVVEIKRERIIDPFFNDFWGLFEFRGPAARERRRAVEGIGTGFLFDPRGYILTNYHVLQSADLIASVTLPSGEVLDVELAGFDERTDLAVLRAKGERLPHAPLGTSADLMIGEWVIAIGNPFGTMMRDPQPSVSVGVVSANHRWISREVARGERLYQDMIQTDAAINPGNSGGPLVNANGEVVGVNTMIFSSSGGSQGLGFAIPADRVKRVAAEIIEFGRRRNPWFGFRGESVSSLNEYSRRRLGLTATSGVLVSEILRSSPAFRAGLELGDVITEVNGQAVAHPADIDFINWNLFVGDDAAITVDRQGKSHALSFKVEEVQAP